MLLALFLSWRCMRARWDCTVDCIGTGADEPLAGAGLDTIEHKRQGMSDARILGHWLYCVFLRSLGHTLVKEGPSALAARKRKSTNANDYCHAS